MRDVSADGITVKSLIKITKSQNLDVSRLVLQLSFLVLQLSLRNLLKPVVQSRMKM